MATTIGPASRCTTKPKAPNGIYVIDQWPAQSKKFISTRFIYAKKMNADGSYDNPSDNAAAFSVIK
jgi:hypothetical protein